MLWTSGTTTPALRWSDGAVTRAKIAVRPFAAGDGSIVFEWLNEEERWVDFAFLGFENGSFFNPFNTLAEGVAAVPYGGFLNIKSGSRFETASISKRMTIQAIGGPVTIGP